ncbi:esterase/lipase family protein [Anatilimnocola sp. NA78]|uniref:esterase/lipase family protein n=1 Tax=Anatilimnocola sp. NA78 TaxID=3415683 RepID=UPI003CE5A91F
MTSILARKISGNLVLLGMAVVASALLAVNARGQQPAAAPFNIPAIPAFTPPNIPSVTLGGEQFWSDELVRNGWRVQINAMTGHHRLLDAEDVRRAWGTHQDCVDELNKTALQEKWAPPKKRAVITMHGLIRSREAMEGIGEFLAKEGDYEWVNVGYASTRRTVDQHAESLAKVIDGLDGVDEINFVCHSLGNIVVRRYLGEAATPNPKWKPDPRIKRLVMLGPPNNGAELAKRFKGNKLVAMVLGSSGKMLAGDWEQVSTRLCVPKCEFGIIAGGNGTDDGANLLIAGDDDAVVAVAETRLPGACDFRTVNLLHGQLMNNDQVRTYALNFLQQGCFESRDLRRPITIPEMPK